MNTIEGFKGYYMRDSLPAELSQGESIIINLDDSQGSGTHWITVFHGTDGSVSKAGIGAGEPVPAPVFYFDSFGLPPSDAIVERLHITAYSNNTFQRMESVSCGLFCLYVLHYCVSESIPFEEVIESGDYLIPFDSMANEKKIKELLTKL
jgi:hypothetical protein